MPNANEHGLKRDIPDAVKRLVRQRCGFGCVICGMSLVEYDHLTTQYADAQNHDPDGIVLLCGSHHSERTRGQLSAQTVLKANANPKCKQVGYWAGRIDLGGRPPYLKLGGITLRHCRIPIQVGGRPVIRIDAPEEADAPYRLSATFSDAAGEPSLEIVKNEWRVSTGQWDAEIVGNTTTIRTGLGQVCLRLVTVPPDGVEVEKIDMALGAYRFRGDRDDISIISANGGIVKFAGCVSDGCVIGFDLA